MKKTTLVILTIAVMAMATIAQAATNPFMDVPANHWAYDAVAQLASRGIISGFPDGAFKGAQPATRYEMASALARAVARIDMEKASKQDVELLKKLIVEFKDELDALGVKVDKIDARLAVMEKDLGGWALTGELRFDAKFGSNEFSNQVGGANWYDDDAEMIGKNEFDLNRYRIFLTKRVNETTNFVARLGTSTGKNQLDRGMEWERYYITTKLPYDITMTVGRQNIDWEAQLGLYADNDALVGDYTFNQIGFAKTWGMANMNLIVGRHNDAGAVKTGDYFATAIGLTASGQQIEQFLIAGKVDVNFSEKFRAGLLGYYFFTDKEIMNTTTLEETDTDALTLGAYMGFAFTPSIELKALYYYQDLGTSYAKAESNPLLDDSPAAWKVMLDVKQDALKYTSLWLEYGQIDNTFVSNHRMQKLSSEFGAVTYSGLGADALANQPINNNTATVILVRADQKWNDRWSTYARYMMADFDTINVDDTTNWTVGVGYQLNPAVNFELAYDSIDYGTGIQARNGDDNIVRFRTYVTF